MRLILALCVCVCLTGCSAIKNLERGIELGANILEKGNHAISVGKDIIEKGEAVMEKAGDMLSEVKVHAKKADTDKDGSTSAQEWLVYLLGSVGGLAGLWKLISRNLASDKRKSESEKELAITKVEMKSIADKVAAIEASIE